MQVYNYDKLNVLHFQHQIYDLENGHFEVLAKGEFCRDLLQYLKRLFDLGHNNIIANILEKIGTCVVEHHNHVIKTKALGIIADFTCLLGGQKDKDLYRIVASILTRWLRREKEYHASYEKIFAQIKAMVIKMFSLRLWSQSEPLIAVSRDIASGSVPKDKLLQKHTSKLHRDVAEKKIIYSLIQVFLESKEPNRTVTGDLLKGLAPYSSEAMILGLFKCNRKDLRLTLLEMIQGESEGVLPILIKKLKDKQPWYVVRNSMILLGSLKDSDLYSFARPFLCHPESRVQCDVVNCIVALGGKDVSERLIAAFLVINDDVKKQLINLLEPLEDPNVGALFLDILEQRMTYSSKVREDLIQTICSSRHLQVSERVVKVLRDIVKESEYLSVDVDPSLEAARKLLQKFEDSDNQL